jgi:hypothetical protein
MWLRIIAQHIRGDTGDRTAAAGPGVQVFIASIGKGLLEGARRRSVRCVRCNAARVGAALADSFGRGAVFVVTTGGPKWLRGACVAGKSSSRRACSLRGTTASFEFAATAAKCGWNHSYPIRPEWHRYQR